MTPEQLDEWERVCAEASEGPWRAIKIEDAAKGFHHNGHSHWLMCEIGCLGYWTGHKDYHEGVESWCLDGADAAFIALARTALPELIAEVRRLRKIVGERVEVAWSCGVCGHAHRWYWPPEDCTGSTPMLCDECGCKTTMIVHANGRVEEPR